MKNKKRTLSIIGVLVAIFFIGLGFTSIYQNQHFAPDFSSSKQVFLQGYGANKLNKYQKKQFGAIARDAIDQKDGPYEWTNFDTVGINVIKEKKPATYTIVYKVKSNSSILRPTIRTDVTVKLDFPSLKNTHYYDIKKYDSDFSYYSDDD